MPFFSGSIVETEVDVETESEAFGVTSTALTEARPARRTPSMLLALLTSMLLVLTGLATAPAALAAEPVVVQSTTTASSTGLTVQVNASGLPDSIYAAMIEKGTAWKLVDQGSTDYVAFALPFPKVTDGKASFTMSAPKAKLDRKKKYELVVWKIHSAATEDNIYSLTDVAVTEAQWNTVFAVAQPTTTTVKFAKSTAKYNAANSATVTVTSKSGTPTGKVNLTVAGKKYTANLSKGAAKIKLAKAVKVGTHTATANYLGATGKFTASKATTKVKVAKATPKVSLKLAKSKVKASKNAKVTVTVTIPGSLKAKASKFKVKIYDGKKLLKSATLKSNGKVTVKLPKIKKTGTHKITATVSKTGNTNAKTSAKKNLKVVD